MSCISTGSGRLSPSPRPCAFGADWPSNPELGAAFDVRDGKLLVREVDAGSPAWERLATRAVVCDRLSPKVWAMGVTAWICEDRSVKDVPETRELMER